MKRRTTMTPNMMGFILAMIMVVLTVIAVI